jgi:hypothetical protein
VSKFTITKVEPSDKPNEPRVTIAKDGIDVGVIVIKTISNLEVGADLTATSEIMDVTGRRDGRRIR